MTHRFKPAVPLQAAVKYVVAERDKYKAKLEQLIPYTKQLEEGRSKRIEELENEVKRLRNKLDKKNRDYEELLAECALLKRDYRESAWFAALQENNAKLRQTITTLRKALNQALCHNKEANLGS